MPLESKILSPDRFPAEHSHRMDSDDNASYSPHPSSRNRHNFASYESETDACNAEIAMLRNETTKFKIKYAKLYAKMGALSYVFTTYCIAEVIHIDDVVRDAYGRLLVINKNIEGIREEVQKLSMDDGTCHEGKVSQFETLLRGLTEAQESVSSLP